MSSFQPLSISSPRSNGIINPNSTTTTTTTNSINLNSTNNIISRTGSSSQGGVEEDIKVDVTSPHELTQFVDNLLDNLEARFDIMNKDVLGRLSSLSTRIDSLETSIGELMSGSSNGENESNSTS